MTEAFSCHKMTCVFSCYKPMLFTVMIGAFYCYKPVLYALNYITSDVFSWDWNSKQFHTIVNHNKRKCSAQEP